MSEKEAKYRRDLKEVEFHTSVSVLGRPGNLWNETLHPKTRARIDWDGPEKIIIFGADNKLHSCYPISMVRRYVPKP